MAGCQKQPQFIDRIQQTLPPGFVVIPDGRLLFRMFASVSTGLLIKKPLYAIILQMYVDGNMATWRITRSS